MGHTNPITHNMVGARVAKDLTIIHRMNAVCILDPQEVISETSETLTYVSAQFLHLQISTFDKSSIPTLTHSRMEIASPSFPLYSYPPHDLTIKTNKDKNTKTWFGYSRVVLRQPRQTTSVTIKTLGISIRPPTSKPDQGPSPPTGLAHQEMLGPTPPSIVHASGEER